MWVIWRCGSCETALQQNLVLGNHCSCMFASFKLHPSHTIQLFHGEYLHSFVFRVWAAESPGALRQLRAATAASSASAMATAEEYDEPPVAQYNFRRLVGFDSDTVCFLVAQCVYVCVCVAVCVCV